MTTTPDSTPDALSAVDVGLLLDACIGYRLRLLSIDTGVSVPRLTQEALRLIHDPQVIAGYPRQTRVLRERQGIDKAARRRQWRP